MHTIDEPGVTNDAVFHRQTDKDYPTIVRGKGAVLFDADGKEYIDAAGGIFVVNIGHGVAEIGQAMAQQAERFTFAHTAHFTSEAELDFATRLTELAPPGFNKVWLCTSGSQANETAIKLARSFHLLKGDGARAQVISRWNSYHGSSLGALALTGHTARREAFEPYLFTSPKIEPPYCYRCPFNLEPASCALECATALETAILRNGPCNVSAFIAEPMSGAPLGALVPPPGYLKAIREICDRHGVLMIVDEVITGAGRTGTSMGIDHFDVTPDIITLAKGIGGGFVPLGAVLVHDRVYRAFEQSGQPFRHGETFTGHAIAAAAGSAVLNRIKEDDLVAMATRRGERLGNSLQGLRKLPIVGDVRGIGLLWGVELVADRVSKAPFNRSLGIAERIASVAAQAGLIVVAGSGCADGEAGDTITLAPPFVISERELDLVVDRLEAAIAQVASELCQNWPTAQS